MRLVPILLLTSMLPCAVLRGADPVAGADLAEAWTGLTEQRHAEAREVFARRLAAGGAEAREARLGLALALLGLQPRTQGNVSAARELLTPLADAAEPDGWSRQARYFLGRIAELHEREPDLALARRHYQRLFDEHPDDPLAQVAAVKIVLLSANAVTPPDAKRVALQNYEAWAERLTYAAARRDFHAVMTQAYLRHVPDDLGAARRHALAAHALGFTDPVRRLSNILRIAELSRVLGDVAQARSFYEQFLAEAGRDGRVLLVRERLAALPSGTAAVAP